MALLTCCFYRQLVQQQRLPSIHNLTGQHPRPATMEQQSFDSSSSSSGNNTLQSLSDTSPAINLTQVFVFYQHARIMILMDCCNRLSALVHLFVRTLR